MFFSAYHFAGDPTELAAGYDRLLGTFPEGEIILNICVQRPDGITVYDTCPSEADFLAFSRGPDFAAALQAAGLQAPRIEPLGNVHALIGPPASVS